MNEPTRARLHAVTVHERAKRGSWVDAHAMRRATAGLFSLGLSVAISPKAIADPFYFAVIDYDGRAIATWADFNGSGRSDGGPGFGFQQSDKPEAFEAGNHLAATISPDGQSHADALMSVGGRIQSEAAVGASVNGIASGVALSSDFFSDMYQMQGVSGGRATVTWNDRVEVNVPGHAPGEVFVETAHLSLDGVASWQPLHQFSGTNCSGFVPQAPSESYTAILDVSGTGVPAPPSSQRGHRGIWSGEYVNGQLTETADVSPQREFEWQQAVVNGQPVDLSFSLTVAEDVRTTIQGCKTSPASGALVYNLAFAHTLAWGGITSIMDASGNPVQDWTVNSLSGFDYAHAAVVAPGSGGSGLVPEPATLLLVTAALGTIGLSRRARKREHRPDATAPEQ